MIASCPYYAGIVQAEGLAFRPMRPDVHPDDTALLGRPLRPPRLGVVRGLFQDMLEPEGLEFMDEVENSLRRANAASRSQSTSARRRASWTSESARRALFPVAARAR